VTWSNLTDAPHTVTARGKWKFASKLFTRNHSVSFTFKKPGTYTYFCSIHPYMKGEIIVRR
jgi:plastocyanin